MSLSVATNVNIDTFKRLDANKPHLLPSQGGGTSEARTWTRFRRVDMQNVSQKVCRLVDAVRTSLLNAPDRLER